jgi:hypothetical protein
MIGSATKPTKQGEIQMPNYCTNNLHVSGDATEVKRFHEAIIKGERKEYNQFSILDNLLPSPENNKDWYEWNCKNYGSKWQDFDGVFNIVTDTEIHATFMSAWSPVGEGIRNVSKQFPTLDFILTYDEGGMAFLGGFAIRNGEFVVEIEGKYPSMTDAQQENEEYDEFYDQVSEVVDSIWGLCRDALGKASV